MKARAAIFSLMLGGLVGGCRSSATTPAATAPAPELMLQSGSIIPSPTAAPMQLQVELYQLSLPIGAVSRNTAFWKRVDEQCVSPRTYDLLYKNGVRVGQAPVSEWGYFREIMQKYPAVTKGNTLIGAEAKPVELPMQKREPFEQVFYFNPAGELIGRSYDACENVLTLTLQSAPHKPQTMRLALCPLVRAQRRRLEYSVLNHELSDIAYTYPERLYDLGLQTDVPAGNFFIVAPSPQATWPTSIGNRFLITDAAAEKMETVLLIVPRTIRLVEEAK